MAGQALIFSAPSGAGKTTLVKRLLENNPDLGFSISASTRPQRTGTEISGKDYYFLSREAFRQKIAQDAFVEWEEVYDGDYYGTLKSEIERIWDLGKNIVFDVDVKGGINLKKFFGQKALSIFVQVPSLEMLEQRLRQRQTETEERITQRLAKAKQEMTFATTFDHIVVNDDLEKAVSEAQQLYESFKES